MERAGPRPVRALHSAQRCLCYLVMASTLLHLTQALRLTTEPRKPQEGGAAASSTAASLAGGAAPGAAAALPLHVHQLDVPRDASGAQIHRTRPSLDLHMMHMGKAKEEPAAANATTDTGSPSNASSGGGAAQPGPCGGSRTHLGYQCSFTTPDGMTIHWSNGTALPINPCTINTTGTGETTNQPPRSFLHFAVEADHPAGRIEIGFPDEPGAPHPAEVVYGAVVGNDTSRPQAGQAFTIFRKNQRQSAFSSSWAAYKRAYRAPAPGHNKLLLCFSRLRSSPNLNTGSDISKEFKMTWATYMLPEPFTLDMQVPSRFGGAIVDVTTGHVTFGVSGRGNVAALHGVLMMLAFGLLLPLGALVPRHRWMFHNMQDNGVPVWLLAHLGLQLVGVLLGAAGAILAFVTFGSADPGSRWWRPHQLLGIFVLVVTLLQVVLGMSRPEAGTPQHVGWYHLHSTVGRVGAVAGVVNMFVGTVLVHQVQGQRLWMWLVPALACAVGLALAALALEVHMVELQRSGRFKPSHVLFKSSRLKDPFLAPIKGSVYRHSAAGAYDTGGAGARASDGVGFASSPLVPQGSMDLYRRRRSTPSGASSWVGQAMGGGAASVPSTPSFFRGAGQQPSASVVSSHANV